MISSFLHVSNMFSALAAFFMKLDRATLYTDDLLTVPCNCSLSNDQINNQSGYLN